MVVQASVIVATRNRPEDVGLAIRSILHNTGIEFELFVIDQSDNDETKRELEPWFDDARLRYIHTSVVGKTKAMNRGVELATAPYVLFTDDDCEVPRDWIQKMVAVFEADRSIGIVFSELIAGPYDASAGFIPTFEVNREATWGSVWRRPQYGLGAAMAIRVDALRAVGGFDEMMGPGGRFPSTDDTEIALRIVHAGSNVSNTKTTHVVHHGFRTWEQGKDLGKRDFIANGGMCAKAIRSGVWGVIPTIVWQSTFVGFLRPLFRGVKRRQRPKGLGRVIYFWQGFIDGFRVDVDRDKVLFKK